MITYTSGKFAEQMNAMDEETRIETAVDQVEQIYPGSRELLVSAQTTDWDNNPYAISVYSNYDVGQVMQFWELLRQNHGRLYLAGEHTSTHVGYMKGTVRSGQRAARELVALES